MSFGYRFGRKEIFTHNFAFLNVLFFRRCFSLKIRGTIPPFLGVFFVNFTLFFRRFIGFSGGFFAENSRYYTAVFRGNLRYFIRRFPHLFLRRFRLKYAVLYRRFSGEFFVKYKVAPPLRLHPKEGNLYSVFIL
jgi:hypothetical protein